MGNMIIKCRVCGMEGSIVGMRKHIRKVHPIEYGENLDKRAIDGSGAPKLLEYVRHNQAIQHAEESE